MSEVADEETVGKFIFWFKPDTIAFSVNGIRNNGGVVDTHVYLIADDFG